MADNDKMTPQMPLDPPCHVLIVEDSENNAATMELALLGIPGLSVLRAPSGLEALHILSQQGSEVHAVITDLNMPNLDGIDLVRRVRTLPQYKYVPIIMVTTESEDSKKQAGKAAGATGWIVKPFRGEQLVALAKRFLK